MKTRKILSLALALVMLMGCMTVTAFAIDLTIILDKTTVTMSVGASQEIDAKLYMSYPANPQDITSTANFTWTSSDENVATVDKGTVTALKAGTTTITVKYAGVSATCTVTVISGTAALNLDTNTKKEIDQNYTFTQASEEYTDVTKVKLDWTINDIAATFKSHKTWDPDTLTWVEAKEDIAVTNDAATFNITNYSSKAIVAKAEFAVETSLAATFTEATFTNNECIVKTPVVQDTTTTYTDASFTALKQTITATLTLKKDAFADLTATTSATKYGTYTITITEAPAALQIKQVAFTNVMGTISAENNEIIFKGDTWEEILENNEGNTVVLVTPYVSYTCYLATYEDGGITYVALTDGDFNLPLFANDIAEYYPQYMNVAVKYADSVSDTIYFFMD